MKSIAKLALLLPASLLAAPPNNQLAMLGSENLYIDDMPVVISATRLEQPLNQSPVATTVIDRDMIEASGAQTIPDVLRLVPGFTVGYIAGNYPVATYHGHSERLSKRIQVVIDGRSVYLPTLAGVSWSDLVVTLDDIERIEVTRGPNASTYGNNAFLAVVSITTKHASQDQGHYTKFTIGKYDTADGIYRFGGQDDNIDYRVSVGTKNNSGTELMDDFTETDYLSYRMDIQLNLETRLFYQGGIQDSVYGDLIENQDDLPNDIEVQTSFQHLRLEHALSDTESLALQYYYNRTDSYEFTISDTFDGTAYGVDSFDVIFEVALESERHDFEATYYFQPLQALRMVTGASMRLDKVNALNVFDANADNTLKLFRGYAHGEYNINDMLFINAGIMLEDNEISGSDIAPRLAFIYQPSQSHSFRMGASRATRTPVLFDDLGYFALHQTITRNGGQPLAVNDPLRLIMGGDELVDIGIFSPNEDECSQIGIPVDECGLNSEEITSLEFGWMISLLDNDLIIDLKLYRDETDELIDFIDQDTGVPGENVDDLSIALSTTVGDPGAVYADNTSSTETTGFEAYMDYKINQLWRTYAFFAYTEIEAENTNPRANDRTFRRLEDSAPRRSFGALIMKHWPESDINTSLAIYHVSDMDWIDRTHNRGDPVANLYTDRSAEHYTKVDFVMRKTHSLPGRTLQYSFILQNLGGTHYDYNRSKYTDSSLQTIEVPGSPQDTRGYFEMAIKFN